jgi:hypothetical protein
MPAPKVPAISDIADKWTRRASSAGPEYEAGVRNPSVDWAQATGAAKASYQQGVTQAIARDAYGKGVTAAGTGKWQERAIGKGPARYAQGVQIGAPDYSRRFAPYAEAMSRVDLPPRGPVGSEANLNRMTPIPRALAALKRK